MQKTILETIRALRNGKGYTIDRTNRNRYRVVLCEGDSSKTAYYFSVPIYQEASGQVVPLQFVRSELTYLLKGSNSSVSISREGIKLEGKTGSVVCNLSGYAFQMRENILYDDGIEIYPTLNGIAVKMRAPSEGVSFSLYTSKAFPEIRANTKYFALMQESFQPFMILSGIGAFENTGELAGPAQMSFQKINDKEFSIRIFSAEGSDRVLWFELNLQEPKLFQDTTVESKNLDENNAFGTTAYLGQSASFGEQWLYMRPDMSIFSDLSGSYIKSAVLYVPTYSKNDVRLRGIEIPQRFCSFGSTWQNKVAPAELFAYGTAIEGYHQLNLLHVLTDPITNMLHRTEGWILRGAGGGYTAISTADSFFLPQILAVNYV